jgi:hypothetical protein
MRLRLRTGILFLFWTLILARLVGKAGGGFATFFRELLDLISFLVEAVAVNLRL